MTLCQNGALYGEQETNSNTPVVSLVISVARSRSMRVRWHMNRMWTLLDGQH